MGGLLKKVLAAHGADTWKTFSSVSAHVVMKGSIRRDDPQTICFVDADFDVSTRHQRAAVSPRAVNAPRRTFRTNVLSFETEGGEFLEEQYNPRSAFPTGQKEQTWDEFQTAYVVDYSVWNILNQPFLFARPGFEATEISPIYEGHDGLERLRITYPPNVAGHSREITCHFGPDGLFRRQDAEFEALGGTLISSFLRDYVDIQGVMVATSRILCRTEDLVDGIPEAIMATMRMRDVEFR